MPSEKRKVDAADRDNSKKVKLVDGDKVAEDILPPSLYVVGDLLLHNSSIRDAYNANDKKLIDLCSSELAKVSANGISEESAGRAYDIGAAAINGRNQLKDAARNVGLPWQKVEFEKRNLEKYRDRLGPSPQDIIKMSRDRFIEEHGKTGDYQKIQKAINSASKTNTEVNAAADEQFKSGVAILMIDACVKIYYIVKSPNKLSTVTKQLIAQSLVPLVVKIINQLINRSGVTSYSTETWIASPFIMMALQSSAATIVNLLIDQAVSLGLKEVEDVVGAEFDKLSVKILNKTAKTMKIAAGVTAVVASSAWNAFQYRYLYLDFSPESFVTPSPPPSAPLPLPPVSTQPMMEASPTRAGLSSVGQKLPASIGLSTPSLESAAMVSRYARVGGRTANMPVIDAGPMVTREVRQIGLHNTSTGAAPTPAPFGHIVAGAVVQVAALSAKDIYHVALKEISAKQLFKNILIRAVGVAYGGAGAAIGGGIGTLVLPGFGTFVGAAVGGFFSGNLATKICKAKLDAVLDDDVVEMGDIFNRTFAKIAQHNNLTQEQIRACVQRIQISIDFPTLARKMYKAGTILNRAEIAKHAIDNVVKQVTGAIPKPIELSKIRPQ